MKTAQSIILDGPREFRSFGEMDKFIAERVDLLRQGKLAASLGLDNIAEAFEAEADDTGRVCLCGKPVGPRKWFCKRCLAQHNRDRDRAKRLQGKGVSV